MRRVNAQLRRARSYANAGKGASSMFAFIQHRRDGSLKRGEGRANYGYDPRKGSKPSILRDTYQTVAEDGTAIAVHQSHGLRRYPCPNHDATERPWASSLSRSTYEALGRTELRALAKEAGVKGWGKMTKAQMVEGLLA